MDADSVPAEAGPHPAAGPFDKRISERLGVTAFEVYQVELPPHEQTVLHDHVDDQVEDTYAFLNGDGWLIVDDETTPVKPGQFAAVVSHSSRRKVRAGPHGLVLIASCAPMRTHAHRLSGIAQTALQKLATGAVGRGLPRRRSDSQSGEFRQPCSRGPQRIASIEGRGA